VWLPGKSKVIPAYPGSIPGLSSKFIKQKETIMSQITERKNAVSIQGLSWRECQNDIASLISTEQISTVQKIVPEMLTACTPKVAGAVKSDISNTSITSDSVLSSPSTLQMTFSKPFTERVKQFKTRGLEACEAKQAAMICSLSEMNLVVTNPARVKERLYKAFSVKQGQETERAMKAVFHELNLGHTKVFTTTLASLCVKASVVSGFPNVTIKCLPVSNRALITAVNDKGQGLISEISVDKNHYVNTSTEVTGIHDGSCAEVMNRFNEELRRLGVKYSSETTRSTRVSHDDAIEQNKRLERTRTLNQRKQRHH